MADALGAGRSRRTAGPGSTVGPSVVPAPVALPAPPALLDITRATWKARTALHRVDLETYLAAGFNPDRKGNVKFSPIADAAGEPIPTIYGGTSFDCAAMETEFHDVPFAPGLKTLAREKLEGQLHSVVAPTADLTLADLRNVPLRKLGVERKQLINTEKDTYPQTRAWLSQPDQHLRSGLPLQSGWEQGSKYAKPTRSRLVAQSQPGRSRW